MRATQTWHEITARSISPGTHNFINDLVERFGDERVSTTLRQLASSGDVDKLLERARKVLATEDARRTVLPVEVDRDALLAIVRGALAPPDGPWMFDSRGLTNDEYTEVLAHSTKRLDRIAR